MDLITISDNYHQKNSQSLSSINKQNNQQGSGFNKGFLPTSGIFYPDNIGQELDNIIENTKNMFYNLDGGKTKKNNQQIDQQNQEIIKIWSNLYYCHRCDTVMDLDSGFHEQPENINELVEKLYQNQNLF